MNHEFPWERSTRAAKALAVGMVFTMSGFALVMVGTSAFLRRHQPHGMELYVVAALPLIPILSMMAVMGIYLRRETDEFKRLVMVRSLLVAMAVALGVNCFAGMLRGFGGIELWPPFAEFATFWVVFGAMQMVQMIANRVKSDD